ncbi:translocation/assembly module TamB domain-containing protein [Halonatronum saccharophilum]|uniref:translocation/assembly module TamB domain-containing protein n=1 Tax=Halonatronum saccharophilum TaxID=150060 RepID=UPI00048A0984|nr:translocation/assembly module TamB domain-containing protein [Halonatronum saccharophilum]
MKLEVLQSKKFIILIILLGIFITSIGFLYNNSNQLLERVKEKVIVSLEKEIGAEIKVESIDIRGLRGLSFKSVGLQDDTGNSLIQIDKVNIDYSFLDILSNTLNPLNSIRRVTLVEPKTNIVQADEGWNFDFLIKEKGGQIDSQSTMKFSLPIYIEGGVVNLKAFNIEESLEEVEGFLRIGNNVGVNLRGRIESIVEDIAIEGIINEGDYRGTLDFDEFSIDRAKKNWGLNFLDDIDIGGKVGGEVNFKGFGDDLTNYSGTVSIKDARFDIGDIEIEDVQASLGINRYGIRVNNFSLRYLEAGLNLKGDIFDWDNPQLSLEYQSSNASLEELSKELAYKVKGDPKIQGRIRGGLTNPNIETKVSLSEGEVEGVAFKDLKTTFYYQDKILNLDNLSFEIGDGRVDSSGTVSFEEGLNYILPVNIEGVDISKLDLPISLEEEGIIDGDFIISGNGIDLKDINMLGSASFRDGSIKGYNFNKLETNLWLNNAKVFLNYTRLDSPYGKINLDGLVDLEGELNLTIDGRGIDLNKVSSKQDIDDIKGIMEFRGEIRGELNSPKLYSSLNIDDLIYSSYSLGEVKGEASYLDNKLELINFNLPRFTASINGPIYLSQGKADIILETDELEGDKLIEMIDIDLPLMGNIQGRAMLTELYPNLGLSGEVYITEGSIYEQNFDSANLKFSYSNDEFVIEDSMVEYKDSSIKGRGDFIDQSLDLYLDTEGFDLVNIDYQFEGIKLEGLIEGKGRIYGPINALKVDSKVNSSDISYNGNKLGVVKGRLNYVNSKLYIRELLVSDEDNSYNLRSSLDLEREKIDSLVLRVDRGSLSYIDRFTDQNLSLPYNFSGMIIASGSMFEPDINLDLGIFSSKGEVINLEGSYDFAEGLDLDLFARNIDLANFNDLNLLPYDLKGRVDITAPISGPIDKLDISAKLKVTDGGVGPLQFEGLEGKLDLTNGNNLEIDQIMNIKAGNNLTVQGNIPVDDREEFDLSINLKDGNLSLLPTFFPEMDFARGRGSVNIEVGGTLEKPQIEGGLKVESGRLSYNLLHREINNLKLELELMGDRIKFKEAKGRYGEDGQFEVKGEITLDGFTPDQYDLSFSGNSLAFEHGFWQGKNDIEGRIIDSFRTPLIKGDVLVYDTHLDISFDWPLEDPIEDPFFVPRLDLNAVPGRNVSLGNNNIDIHIQNGRLNLRFDEQLELNGRVESDSGEFNYYNTKFNLDKGVANFRRDSLIPGLQLSASTTIQGTDIYLDLTGSEEPFDLTLTSNPPLTEEEIIILLTRQGGIGELLDRNYEEAFRSEMWRMIDTSIQNELISRVERSFERSLDLDEVRIKSVLSNEISIEVGKFVWENLMLKYAHTFGIEEELSLGFEYHLNRGIKGFDSLRFDGQYDNLGDYHLNLEATLPF